MTAQEIIEFSNNQIEWYKKQIDFAKGQIDFCNGQLKRTRAEDKELKAFAMERYPNDPMTERIYSGNYIGRETRKYINERAKHYRDIKHSEKQIAHYQKQAREWEKYL